MLNETQKDIINDAIAQLLAGQYKAITGNILVYENIFDESPQQVLREKPCTICAKGALFASKIRLFNNITPLQASNVIPDHAGVFTYSGESLLAEFAPEQLSEIEALFERAAYFFLRDVIGDRAFELANFSRRYLPDDEFSRMMWILLRFRKNGGKKFNLKNTNTGVTNFSRFDIQKGKFV